MSSLCSSCLRLFGGLILGLRGEKDRFCFGERM